MRVVQVSAHYPPNFTSGGTLVPQRVARGMARLGLESFVYAGHLDDSRPPLTTWQEDDGAGVTVRWVTTTPWTAWDDENNWHNPAVESDFRAWLDQVRPDVVHLHSLQTLGGSLVRAAAESGAVTVVTMHDFWWFCARQFLVAPDMRPCSLVVDCGGCPCQVDHAWTVDRLRRLAPDLAAADVVLAPSRSAARVLEANGVDPARLRVDENGVPNPPTDRGPRTADPTRDRSRGPRFMFAGGQDPMKGLPVLAEALRGMQVDLPWEIDLYGAAGAAGVPVSDRVRARPPYAPDELTAVLAEHDVLVLPSVMRESHSILTREALAAGLAVVCTDTLGPEEAVEHGRNGFVVPAGDAAALRAVLERLVADPGLLDGLLGQGSTSPLRDAEDQVAGLAELYAELLEARASDALDEAALAEARAGLMRRVLFVVGINGAPLRYRAHLAAEALESEGATVEVLHYRDPRLPEAAGLADAVVLYRVPATVQVADLVRQVRERARPVPVLFDVDDLIFDPELRGQVHGLSALTPDEEQLWWRGVARYRTTMEMADLYVGSTRTLCEHATRVTGLPSRQFRNGVGRAAVAVSEAALARPRTPGPLRVGYFSGTTTHDADWATVEPAVIAVLQDRPDVELWLGGHLEPTPALAASLGGRVRRLPMMPWQDLMGVLRDVDVNLAPLVGESIFNEAKSAIKWLEAALVETPTVASPTQPFVESIEHGRTGLLAADVDAWAAGVARLLDDDVERARVGAQARREALLSLSPHVQARVYQQILLDAAELVRSGTSRATDWEPVLDDEPLSAADAYVEPYVVDAPAGPASPAVRRVRQRAAAVARVYR
ncbi:glycosyltransferase, partial [Actinotalea ferrariae]|uniref:glycosyltransferase n=1 Tax=Actinotalea ferrariae TaxID=1386098 RepID=UPI001C8C51B8